MVSRGTMAIGAIGAHVQVRLNGTNVKALHHGANVKVLNHGVIAQKKIATPVILAKTLLVFQYLALTVDIMMKVKTLLVMPMVISGQIQNL